MAYVTWDSTSEGQNLNTAYSNLQALFNTKLPGHRQSFLNLSTRQIKG